jgi:hypothetical protein
MRCINNRKIRNWRDQKRKGKLFKIKKRDFFQGKVPLLEFGSPGGMLGKIFDYDLGFRMIPLKKYHPRTD